MQNIRFLIIVVFSNCLCSNDQALFSRIFPFTSLKRVVDTAMRSYTELLILEERLVGHEKCDDLIDLIMGRLMRLSTYIDQIIYAYCHEATIIKDEIEYLIQVLEYMEIGSDLVKNDAIPLSLNMFIYDLKLRLKRTIEPAL